MNTVIEPLKHIILSRLLALPKSGFTKNALKKDLSSLVEHRWVGESWSRQFEEIWNQLLTKGLVNENPKVSLTEAGISEVLQFYGWDKKPSRLQWRAIKDKFLPARFLGLVPGSDQFKKRFKGSKTLRSECLRQVYDLKIQSMPTETEAINAMLSISNIGMLNLKTGEVEKALLRLMIDGKSIDQKKPEQPALKAQTSTTFDLKSFARDVLECARTCPTGQWGSNKVFISHVWRYFQKIHTEWQLDESSFKKKLTEANHHQYITLSHADMVGIMNHADVRESATPYLNDCFHFIRIGRQ